jgi:hypothetical protein
MFNQKHVNVAPPDDIRKKHFDIELVRKFMDKYNLEFVEGYNDKLLNRCLELINSETDAFVLESNFPGHYTDFLPERKKGN